MKVFVTRLPKIYFSMLSFSPFMSPETIVRRAVGLQLNLGKIALRGLRHMGGQCQRKVFQSLIQRRR